MAEKNGGNLWLSCISGADATSLGRVAFSKDGPNLRPVDSVLHGHQLGWTVTFVGVQ